MPAQVAVRRRWEFTCPVARIHQMKLPRIAHVANEAYGFETANGVQQVVYCLARAQAELGHAVAQSRGTTTRCMSLVTAQNRRCPHRCACSRQPVRLAALRAAAFALCRTRIAGRTGAGHGNPSSFTFISSTSPRMSHWRNILAAPGFRDCVTVHGGLFHAAMQLEVG